jgi:alpha-L-rhamnosidase
LTVFPEDWNGDQSHLHSSYEFVGAWFLEGLVGIGQEPGSAGYKHITLHPLITETPTLTHVAGTYQTPHGTIRCAWRREGKRVHVEVTVPPNSRATLHLPAEVVELEPGNHTFETT